MLTLMKLWTFLKRRIVEFNYSFVHSYVMMSLFFNFLGGGEILAGGGGNPRAPLPLYETLESINRPRAEKVLAFLLDLWA